MGKKTPSLTETFGLIAEVDPFEPKPDKRHPGSDMPAGIAGKKKDQTGATASGDWLAGKQLGMKPSERPQPAGVSKGPTPGPIGKTSAKQDIWRATQNYLKGKGTEDEFRTDLSTAAAKKQDLGSWDRIEKELQKQRNAAVKDLEAGKLAQHSPKKPEQPKAGRQEPELAPLPKGLQGDVMKGAGAHRTALSPSSNPLSRFAPKLNAIEPERPKTFFARKPAEPKKDKEKDAPRGWSFKKV